MLDGRCGDERIGKLQRMAVEMVLDEQVQGVRVIEVTEYPFRSRGAISKVTLSGSRVASTPTFTH